MNNPDTNGFPVPPNGQGGSSHVSLQNAMMVKLSTAFDLPRWKRVIRRNVPFIVLVMGLSAAGMWLYVSSQPKIYSSRAVLQVEQQERKVLNKIENINEEKLDTDDYVKTVVELLTSNSLLVQVVRDNGLDKDFKFAPPKRNGQPYLDSELAARMAKKIHVSLRRGTRLIDIEVEDTSPATACALANSVVKEFLGMAYEQNSSVAKTAGEALVLQAARLKNKLEVSEQKLQQYKEEHQAVSLEERQNITVEKLKDINTKVTEAKSQRMKLEADLVQIQRADRNDVSGLLQIGSVAALPQVAEIRTQLIKAQSDFASIQNRYLGSHPKYIAAKTAIDELNRSLADAVHKSAEIVTQQYQAALDIEQKLGAALKQQEEEALKLNKISIPYNVLAREAESDRIMYDNTITRMKETSATQGVEQVPYRIAETAMVQSDPIRPRKLKMMVLAILGGAALAFGIVVGGEMLNNSVQSVDEGERWLDMPALAVVPECGKRGIPNAFAHDPGSPQSEAFRSLRASLAFPGDPESRRSFAITSAIPLEGKSYVSLNLAVAFARQGLRTLIIEADLRRPSVSKFLLNGEKREHKGLTEYLGQLATEGQVVYSTGTDKLFVLPAGRLAPNPAELLAQADFRKLLDYMSEEFDRVVIDTAPVNVVSDTLSIVAHADGVCLVVRTGKTPTAVVQEARQKLLNAGGQLSGFVMNRMPPDGMPYHSYQYKEEPREHVYSSTD